MLMLGRRLRDAVFGFLRTELEDAEVRAAAAQNGGDKTEARRDALAVNDLMSRLGNLYDKNDVVRREAVIIAGAMKIGAYRIKALDTGEFGALQFHMTYDNTVMAVMGESAAKLFADFVKDTVARQQPDIDTTTANVAATIMENRSDRK